ncbi:MAG: C1 family peptidase [Planctomycetota bacterium]|nr:C1 family peptidase [Planctomycetota bacterium]MEC8252237.1 C1 family peptidase [Planctomycetota bacterium]MEC8652804.1 C1 family peptidase [Planctomycetota bacterium]
MREFPTHAFLGGVLLAAFATAQEKSAQPEGYRFTVTSDTLETPVPNQQRAGTCWSYASGGMVEAEMLRMGKPPVDLSEMYVVRMSYEEKAKRYVRMHGNCNFTGGGALNDSFDVLGKYGMMPESAYKGLNYGTDVHTHGELDEVLKTYLDGVIKNKNKKLSTAWFRGFQGILDAYLGPVPASFEFKGRNYTARTFADEVVGVNPADYVFFSSFTHHPFYEQFVLEVPDNWTWASFWNVPLDQMADMIEGSVKAGYSVCWASDVSERGFASGKGVAVVPQNDIAEMDGTERLKWEKMDPSELSRRLYSFDSPMPEKVITQEMRQLAFDNYETTDDHAMVITGLAKDQNGTPYFRVKNSWGSYNKLGGHFFASRAFVEYKTLSWGVHKDAVPEALREKLGID